MALGEWKDRIIIQKSVAGNDKAGNHVLEWQDYYTCHAYVNNLSGKEYWEAAQLNAEKEVFFLIRYCSEAAAIDTEHFRILFRGQVYNITFIDNVKYQNKTLKLRAALEKRGGRINSPMSDLFSREFAPGRHKFLLSQGRI